MIESLISLHGGSTDARGTFTEMRSLSTELRGSPTSLRGNSNDLREPLTDLRGISADLGEEFTGEVESFMEGKLEGIAVRLTHSVMLTYNMKSLRGRKVPARANSELYFIFPEFSVCLMACKGVAGARVIFLFRAVFLTGDFFLPPWGDAWQKCDAMRFVRNAMRWMVLSPSAAFSLSLEEISLRCGYRISEVCRELRCSERYLYEVAKRDIGLPPKVWMRQERMVRARNMVAGGVANQDVAEKLGFASTGSFRREFVTAHGVRPADYVESLSDRTDGEPIFSGASGRGGRLRCS